jgi:hypothetical protein
VEVISNFDLIVPLIPININEIVAESARTVIKDIPVGVLVPPLAPADDFNVDPPWVYFEESYQFKDETVGSTTIRIIASNPGENIPYPINVYYRVSGLSEAEGGGIDYQIIDPSPKQIPENTVDSVSSADISIEIINDLLFEYHERVILFITDAKYVVGGNEVELPKVNIVSPYVHVLYIIDDDRILPVITFAIDQSQVYENTSDGVANVSVGLDKPSGRDTSFDLILKPTETYN